MVSLEFLGKFMSLDLNGRSSIWESIQFNVKSMFFFHVYFFCWTDHIYGKLFSLKHVTFSCLHDNFRKNYLFKFFSLIEGCKCKYLGQVLRRNVTFRSSHNPLDFLLKPNVFCWLLPKDIYIGLILRKIYLKIYSETTEPI